MVPASFHGEQLAGLRDGSEFNPAIFHTIDLLDGLHLAFQPGNVRSSGAVTLHEEQGGPEKDKPNAGHCGVIAAIGLLNAIGLGCASRHCLSFGAEFTATESFVK